MLFRSYYQPEANYFRGGLGFYTNNSASLDGDHVERMRIDMSGNVGIGTTYPERLLHLYSASTTEFKMQTSIAGGDMWITSYNENNDRLWIVNMADRSHGDMWRLWSQGHSSGASYVVSVDTDGKFAIGRNKTPGYELDVVGDINFTGNIRHNGSIVNFSSGTTTSWNTAGTNTTSGNVTIGSSTARTYILQGEHYVYYDSNNYSFSSIRRKESDLGSVFNNPYNSETLYKIQTSIWYKVNSSADGQDGKVAITSAGDGRVGIGTTLPHGRLEIKGKDVPADTGNTYFTHSNLDGLLVLRDSGDSNTKDDMRDYIIFADSYSGWTNDGYRVKMRM